MRLLEDYSVKPGDRVAILSTSMPNWGAAYFAITFMGAVAVPVLPDFTPGEIANVLEHSEAKILLVSGNLAHKVADYKSGYMETVIQLTITMSSRFQGKKLS
jgi:long-chain acyl-CoA synthetase